MTTAYQTSRSIPQEGYVSIFRLVLPLLDAKGSVAVVVAWRGHDFGKRAARPITRLRPTLEDTIVFFNLILELKLDDQEKADLVAFQRQLSRVPSGRGQTGFVGGPW